MSRSNLVAYAFLYEKVKSGFFRNTIAACDLKVSTCRQLIEFMKVSEIEGQGLFVSLAQGHLHLKIKTIPLGHFETTFVCKLWGTDKRRFVNMMMVT